MVLSSHALLYVKREVTLTVNFRHKAKLDFFVCVLKSRVQISEFL